MTPIKNKIYARVLKPKPTPSGIYLPENANLQAHTAEVLLVGPEVKHFKPGDHVKFNHVSVKPYEEDGEKYVFLREDQDILLLV